MSVCYPDYMTWANQYSWFALFYKVNYGLIINLILFVAFMFTCYIAALWLSKNNGLSGMPKSGRIVERIYLSPQASLMVVELQGVYYLFSLDKSGVHLIDKREDWVVSTHASERKSFNFETILSKTIHSKKDRT